MLEVEIKENIENDYKTFANDPTNLRIYTLKNGLRVYLSVIKDTPRIQTFVAVKAGSKFDPPNSTGLAHYLEHMMFKGSENYGTADYAKEKLLLDEIEALFEVYKMKTDEKERAEIYRRIDSLSQEASHLAIANEYDKMCANIGAEGTNAFTSNERTVYVNNIPSNQLEKWLHLESERFSKPVFRLFHTELEAVYEEKNGSLDDDASKEWEALMYLLFPDFPYGTQTTLGTIHDLKNPSLKDIKAYFYNYYVPNNMAICMAGDFDPDTVIKSVEKYFGRLEAKEVPPFTKKSTDVLTTPKEKTVVGPDPAELMMGFRTKGNGTRDADMLKLIGGILDNGTAGLIDLNINQQQKALEAWAGPYSLNDYSIFLLGGKPANGQSLAQLKDLLLAEIDKLKSGDFPDWLPQAVVNDMKVQMIKAFSTDKGRAFAFVNAFTENQNWDYYLAQIDRISAFTKQDIIDFAKTCFKNNYAVVYKETGIDEHVEKIVKPAITPIQLNRESESIFLKDFETIKTAKIKPRFVDYEKDIDFLEWKDNIPLWYKKNDKNELFYLYYHFDFGTSDSKHIKLAAEYLKLLGTDELSPKEVQERFYRIGCHFDVDVKRENTYVVLSGLQENFDEGLRLFENLLSHAQPDAEALKGLIENTLQSRADAKRDKRTILFTAMRDFATYGAKNPFTFKLSKEELMQLEGQNLTEIIHSLTSCEHKIMYFGPKAKEFVSDELKKRHQTPNTLNPVPHNDFKHKDFAENNVYFCHFDMKQAEIIALEKDETYNSDLVPLATLFNEYFGGNMSSVIFQELRESRALAYSTFSSYIFANRTGEPNYDFSYIGTQADKMVEATKSMLYLLDTMPKSLQSFESSRNSILQRIRAKRTVGQKVFFSYMTAQKRGLNYDIDQKVFDEIPRYTYDDILRFQQEHIQGHKRALLIIGNEKELDFRVLEAYGEVQRLSLEEVFGY